MNPRLRYGLILLGFVVFILLTPIIVLFVSGTKYDWDERRFVKTGTISVKTNPKKAEIYINGKRKGFTPKTLRFLNGGDYEIQIVKKGYFDWNKRLNVRPQFVTWINKDLDALILFFKAPQSTNISGGVTNFYTGKNKLAYISGNKFTIVNKEDLDNKTEFNLPTSDLEIIASNNEKYYLIYSDNYYAVIDTKENKIFDITPLLTIGSEKTFEFSRAERLYVKEGLTLSEVLWGSQKKNTVLGNVIGYHVNSEAIYAIESENYSLVRVELPSFSTHTLLEKLPPFTTAKIILSPQNKLVILGDNTLYAISDRYEPITNYAVDAVLNNNGKKVVYASGNELGMYDFSIGINQVITRSSKAIKNPAVLDELGWAFMINDNRLQNIELDNRDHRNNYTFSQVSDESKFYIDDEGKNIYLLNTGTLQRLKIRD